MQRGYKRAGATGWALAVWLLAAPAAAAELETTKLTLTLPDGRPLQAVIQRPSVAFSERLPAIILLGGFRSAEQTLAALQTDQALIRASFVYPYTAPGKVTLGGLLAAVQDFGRGVDDTFAGIDALVLALRARPDVDSDRLVLVGVSAGAPFATIGAVRNRVPQLIIVQGFGLLPQVIARQFDLKLAARFGSWLAPLNRLTAEALSWYLQLPDPAAYAARLERHQRVLFMHAPDDERIPKAATMALQQALASSQAQLSTETFAGGHLRGLDDPRIPAILQSAMDWMNGLTTGATATAD